MTPLHEQFEKKYVGNVALGIVPMRNISDYTGFLRTASAQIEKEAYERGRTSAFQEIIKWAKRERCSVSDMPVVDVDAVLSNLLSFLANQEK